MNKQTAQFFQERDYPPPRGATPMTVRYTVTQRFGPYTIIMESSCGREPPLIAGSVKISLFDVRTGEKPVGVKRLQVSDWREVQVELERLRWGLTARST